MIPCLTIDPVSDPVSDGRGDASSTVTLQYIDYGNTDQQIVGQVRFLPDTMKNAPAAAYKCKLVNVSGAPSYPPSTLTPVLP